MTRSNHRASRATLASDAHTLSLLGQTDEVRHIQRVVDAHSYVDTVREWVSQAKEGGIPRYWEGVPGQCVAMVNGRPELFSGVHACANRKGSVIMPYRPAPMLTTHREHGLPRPGVYVNAVQTDSPVFRGSFAFPRG